MSVNFSGNDYSYLFSSLNQSTSGVNSASSLLSDYASIKNGSYGKLMKAYYAKDKTSGSSSKSSDTKADKTTIQNLNKVQTATEDLKKSADALSNKEDITYDDIKSFVDSYNSVVNAGNKVSDKSTVDRATRMVENTLKNVKLLKNVGITINEDSTLSVDKDTFEKANKNTVNTLFKGAGSFGYNTSSQASLVKQSADRAVSKAGTYNAGGNYDKTESATGNLYNSYT